MYIPVFLNIRAVDKDDFLTTEFQIYEDTLNQSMRGALSDDGWTIPQIGLTQLNLNYPDMPNGTIWYLTEDDTIPVPTPINLFVGKLNGALIQFTTAPYP